MIIITCIYTPYTVAFINTFVLGFTIADQIQNVIFFIDIIINFFSAYYDEDFVIIDDFKVRAIYLNQILANRQRLRRLMVSR